MLKKCINDSYELDKITNVVSEYTGVPIEKLMHKTRASLKFIGH
jgi:hypothetical protein